MRLLRLYLLQSASRYYSSIYLLKSIISNRYYYQQLKSYNCLDINTDRRSRVLLNKS